MAERPRELDQRFQMGGSIWGYYRLRSYFSRHCDTTQFTLTHHMVNKPFLLLGLAAEYRSRRRRRRCANNIAADHHMFITLAGQLSWQRLRRSAVDLYSKAKKNRSLGHPLGHLGITYALHLWLVGKPVVDFIFVVIELFFVISYGWDVMSGNRSKSLFFEGGGSLWTQISEGTGRRRPTTLGIRVAAWLPFRVV